MLRMEDNFTKPPVRVEKEVFIEAWRQDREERARREPGGSDEFDRDHLERHKEDRPNVAYHRVELAEIGVDNIILPHHTEDPRADPGGEPIDRALLRYLGNLSERGPRADRYPPKLVHLMDYFTGLSESGLPLSVGCMFIYDDVIFTEARLNKHGFRNHGECKLYAANYHRFAAYWLWKHERGYGPVGVYYCTKDSDWR